jgi:hypothetical protein
MSAPLYQLTGEYAALQARAEDGEDVGDALAAIDDAIDVKAERIAAVLRNLKGDQELLRAEEKRLADRRRSLENNEERLREYIRTSMVSAGLTRVKCPAFTLSLSERESVVVENAEAVPEEFTTLKVETRIDTKAVLAAYKNSGECVPGTRVATNHILTIR